MPRITYTDENTSPGGRHHISCPRMLEIKDPRVTGGSPGHWYGLWGGHKTHGNAPPGTPDAENPPVHVNCNPDGSYGRQSFWQPEMGPGWTKGCLRSRSQYCNPPGFTAADARRDSRPPSEAAQRKHIQFWEGKPAIGAMDSEGVPGYKSVFKYYGLFDDYTGKIFERPSSRRKKVGRGTKSPTGDRQRSRSRDSMGNYDFSSQGMREGWNYSPRLREGWNYSPRRRSKSRFMGETWGLGQEDPPKTQLGGTGTLLVLLGMGVAAWYVAVKG